MKHQISINLSEEQLEKIDQFAKNEKTNRSQFLRNLIDKELESFDTAAIYTIAVNKKGYIRVINTEEGSTNDQ